MDTNTLLILAGAFLLLRSKSEDSVSEEVAVSTTVTPSVDIIASLKQKLPFVPSDLLTFLYYGLSPGLPNTYSGEQRANELYNQISKKSLAEWQNYFGLFHSNSPEKQAIDNASSNTSWLLQALKEYPSLEQETSSWATGTAKPVVAAPVVATKIITKKEYLKNLYFPTWKQEIFDFVWNGVTNIFTEQRYVMDKNERLATNVIFMQSLPLSEWGKYYSIYVSTSDLKTYVNDKQFLLNNQKGIGFLYDWLEVALNLYDKSPPFDTPENEAKVKELALKLNSLKLADATGDTVIVNV